MADHLQSPTTTNTTNINTDAGAPDGGGSGGFIVPSLPSPAPSSTTTATTTTHSSCGLPHPRGHALRPGSGKEDQVRNFVEQRLFHINRRYVKKFALVAPDDEVVGYKSMAELCKDLDGLLNIVWLSGTPSLQIPYLLNIAIEFNTWVTSFAFSPASTFSVLRKLDHCFASLLAGQDMETKEALPGFENGLRAGLSRTDMVRCKSTVQRTRVLIVQVMNRELDNNDGAQEADQAMTSDDDDENDCDGDGPDSGPTTRTAFQWVGNDGPDSGPDSGPTTRTSFQWAGNDDDDDDDNEELHMDVAQVYENTLVQLGETLGEDAVMDDIPIFGGC